MGEQERASEASVVLVRPDGEAVVFRGSLEDCEDWLATNGDAWEDGHLEIRPGNEMLRDATVP